MTRILILVLCVLSIFAEDNVLLSGDVDHGGWGGFEFGVSQILDETTMIVGGRGGWTINHTLTIGGAGWGMIPDFEKEGLIPFNPDSVVSLNMGAGGLLLEYVWGSEKVVHFNVGAMIGWGGIAITEKYDYEQDDEWDESNSVGDGFFIAEPHLGLELNMMKFWRINIGARYRYISGIDKFNLEDSDFSGTTGYIQFRFGDF